eukprot:2615397-Rhodomonas_salina.3
MIPLIPPTLRFRAAWRAKLTQSHIARKRSSCACVDRAFRLNSSTTLTMLLLWATSTLHAVKHSRCCRMV